MGKMYLLTAAGTMQHFCGIIAEWVMLIAKHWLNDEKSKKGDETKNQGRYRLPHDWLTDVSAIYVNLCAHGYSI